MYYATVGPGAQSDIFSPCNIPGRRHGGSVGDSEVVERGLTVILCWRALKDRVTHQVLGNDVCVIICNNNLYNASNKY